MLNKNNIRYSAAIEALIEKHAGEVAIILLS